jgi:hypothetical protein
MLSKYGHGSVKGGDVVRTGAFNLQEIKVLGQRIQKSNSLGGKNWAAATLGFISMDLSIPEATDGAWPKWAGYALVGGLAAAYIYSGDIMAKMEKEIEGIKRHASGPPGFVYELRATRAGLYPNLNTGKSEQLNVGDIYKYGQTTKGFGRYSQSELTRDGLQMIPIFYGNQVEIRVHEKL